MHLFDLDTSSTSSGPNLFTGRISENWSINKTPNGGYLMALLANTMLSLSDKRYTPILTANYVSRCSAGEADIRVEEFSRSAQFNRYQAGLYQGGKERIRAMGTFVEEKIECFIERYDASPPDMAPRESCIPLPQLEDFSLLHQMDMLLDPACAGWMQGRLSEKSEMRGWITFHEERPHDLLSVLLAADCFPPPVFASQGMMAWVPTIEFSVNVRKIPLTRWLKGVFRSRFVTCGLVESDGEIWDEEGTIVAISRQIAQFRNT